MNRKEMGIIFLIILAISVLSVHISTTTVEFSRYNRYWTGTSGLFTDLDLHGAQELASYDDLAGRNDTLLLIIAPAGSFPETESAAIREFLAAGNTIFIADETETSNPLIDEIGGNTRIRFGDISSVDREFRDPWSVLAFTREPDPLLANVSALTLNRPSAVMGGITLMSTTPFSWDDSKISSVDEKKNFSSFGILAREQVGYGTLYVHSDPSIFVNGMRRAEISGDNEIFIQNLLSLHRNILVDHSHSQIGRADPILMAATWVKNNLPVKVFTLLLTVLLVAVAFRRKWI